MHGRPVYSDPGVEPRFSGEPFPPMPGRSRPRYRDDDNGYDPYDAKVGRYPGQVNGGPRDDRAFEPWRPSGYAGAPRYDRGPSPPPRDRQWPGLGDLSPLDAALPAPVAAPPPQRYDLCVFRVSSLDRPFSACHFGEKWSTTTICNGARDRISDADPCSAQPVRAQRHVFARRCWPALYAEPHRRPS